MVFNGCKAGGGEIMATPDLGHQNNSPVQGVGERAARPRRSGPVPVGWLRLRGLTRVWAPHEGSCCGPETARRRSAMNGCLLWAPCEERRWSEVGMAAETHVVMGFIPPPALV